MLHENRYRLTLYVQEYFDGFLTYDFPLLPDAGDYIEIEHQRTFFVVKNRSFRPGYQERLIPGTLFGIIDGQQEMSRAH